jgi:hypothetical protein
MHKEPMLSQYRRKRSFAASIIQDFNSTYLVGTMNNACRMSMNMRSIIGYILMQLAI